jgi:hypothetical protein
MARLDLSSIPDAPTQAKGQYDLSSIPNADGSNVQNTGEDFVFSLPQADSPDAMADKLLNFTAFGTDPDTTDSANVREVLDGDPRAKGVKDAVLESIKRRTFPGDPQLRQAPEPTFWETMRGYYRHLTGAPARERAAAEIEFEARQAGLTVQEYKDQLSPENAGIRRVDRFFKGVQAGAISVGIEGAGATAQWLTDGEIGGDLANQAQLWAQELNVPPADRQFTDDLANGVGSMLVFFIPGMGAARGSQALFGASTRLAAWAGTGTMTAIEASTEAGLVYRNMIQRGKSPEEAEKAATTTFWFNVPLLTVTNKLGIFAEKGGFLRKFAGGGTLEGTQEAGQEVISSLATGDSVRFGDLVNSFGVGFITGGGASMVERLSRTAPGLTPPNGFSVNGDIVTPERAEAPTEAPVTPEEAITEEVEGIPTREAEEAAAVETQAAKIEEAVAVSDEITDEQIDQLAEAVAEEEISQEEAEELATAAEEGDLEAATRLQEQFETRLFEREIPGARAERIDPETVPHIGQRGGRAFRIELPNGTDIRIVSDTELSSKLSDAEKETIRKTYIDAGVPVTKTKSGEPVYLTEEDLETGDFIVAGRNLPIGRTGVIVLAKDQTARQLGLTFREELFELAEKTVLTPQEIKAVEEEIGSFEARSKAYAAWDGVTAAPSTAFEKIKNFFATIAQRFTGAPLTAEEVFRRVRAGEVFRRAPGTTFNLTFSLDPIPDSKIIKRAAPELVDIQKQIVEPGAGQVRDYWTDKPTAFQAIDATINERPNQPRMLYRAAFLNQIDEFGNIKLDRHRPHKTDRGIDVNAVWFSTSYEFAKAHALSRDGGAGQVIIEMPPAALPNEFYIQNTDAINRIDEVWVGVPSDIDANNYSQVLLTTVEETDILTSEKGGIADDPQNKPIIDATRNASTQRTEDVNKTRLDEQRRLDEVRGIRPVEPEREGVDTEADRADRIEREERGGFLDDTFPDRPTFSLTLDPESGKPTFDVNQKFAELRERVEAGQAGERIYDPLAGEGFGIGSSFPDFMRDRGWSKAEVLSAFKKLDENKALTERQTEMMQAALVQAESEFLDEVFRSKGEFLDATEFLEEGEEIAIAREASDAFLKKMRTRQPTKLEKAKEKIAEQKERIERMRKQAEFLLKRNWQAEDKVTEQRTQIFNLQDQIADIKQARREETKEIRAAARDLQRALRADNKERVKQARKDLRESIARRRTGVQETAQKRKLSGQIFRELKGARVKMQGGKPVGKFTAEQQRILDRAWNAIKDARKMSETAIDNKIQQNLAPYEESNEMPPQEVVIENKMLSLFRRPLTSRSVEELETMLEEIRAFKEEGKLMRAVKDFDRETRIENQIENAVDMVTNGKGIDPLITSGGKKAEEVKQRGLWDKTKKVMNDVVSTMESWEGLVDMLSVNSEAAPMQSELSKFSDVTKETRAERAGVKRRVDTMYNMMKKAYGLKSNKQVESQIREDTKEVDFGTIATWDGKIFSMKMSKAEARKRYMEMLDPTLYETFTDPKGKMMWTYDSFSELLESFKRSFTDADIEFIRLQMEEYQKEYGSINDVYSDIYGADLPQNPMYSPIARDVVTKDVNAGFGENMETLHWRASAAPGATKARTRNLFALKLQSDIQVLQRHASEMERFKAWAPKIRDLRAVYGDKRVQDAIKQEHGTAPLKVVQSFLDDFSTGGMYRSRNISWLEKFRINMTRSVLAIKPSLTVKQLTSFIAFAEAVPVKDYVKGQLKFFTVNPQGKVDPQAAIKNWQWLAERSTMLQTRGENMERDIKAAMQSEAFNNFSKAQSFLNSLMLNIRLGDRAAIIAGGWAVVQHELDQGKSIEEAVEKFENVAEAAQQSAALAQQSFFQRSDFKIFTMFLSSPNQYFRKEVRAIRELSKAIPFTKGTVRGSKAQHLKTIAIYHAIIPMLFQWVSDGFEWDEEEQLRALILGSFNGIFILGDMLDYIVRAGVGAKQYSNELPITSVARDFSKVARTFTQDDIDTEDVLDATRAMASGVGAITGAPLKTSFDLLKGTGDIATGEFERGLWTFSGYSPSLAEEKARR